MLSSFRDSFWAGRRTAGSVNPVVTNGLVLYVDALNPNCYPGTGDTWYDISGQDNDLTLQNPESIEYRNQYFRTGYSGFFSREVGNNVPQGNNNYCMGLWARQPFFWGNAAGLIAIGSYGVPQQSNQLRIDQSIVGRFQHTWWGTNRWGGDLIGVAPRIKLNKWFLVMVQYNGTNRQLWVNGNLVVQDTPTPGAHNVTSSLIQISRVDPYGQAQNGDVAIGFIYNRSLFSNEIKRIFQSNRGRFGL
jgi:Concanavalin A-like lectin/glucanases superfamily